MERRFLLSTLTLSVAFTLAWLLALPGVVFAQAEHTFTSVGETYSENFDALPNDLASATNFVNADGGTPTLAKWYADAESNPPAQIRTNPAQGAGSIYSFGTGNNTERALGAIGSGGPDDQAFGVKMVNNTGGALTQLEIALVFERWREGGDGDNFTRCFYRIGGTAFDLAQPNPAGRGWVEITQLVMQSAQSADGNDNLLDGNDPANQQNLSHTLSGVNIPNGETVWLGWRDYDEFGIDHGIAIDDLSVTVRSAAPVISVTSNGETVGDGGVVNVLTNGTLAGLNMQIDVSDAQADNVTLTATFVNNPGFTPAEWEGGPAASLTLNPSTGTFGTAEDVEVTLTATDDDVANNQSSITIIFRVTDPLNVGDVMIIGYRTDPTVGFAFVARVDLPAGLQLKFTDDGADGAGDFDGNESVLTWTAPPNGVRRGTVVVVTDDGVLPAPDDGSATGTIQATLDDGASGGDQLFCFQGVLTVAANRNLLFGINFGNAGWLTGGVPGINRSYLPAELNITYGNLDAGAVSAADNAQYTGGRDTQKNYGDYDPMLADLGNWTFESLGSLTLDTTDLTLDPTIGTGGGGGCALAGGGMSGTGSRIWWCPVLLLLATLVVVRRRVR